MKAYEQLQRSPEQFGFTAALRLYECTFPDRPRLGRSLREGERSSTAARGITGR